MDGTVAGLWRYPVAGMLGEELDVVVLEAGGPLGDDAFVVVAVDGDADPGPDPTALLDFRATCTAEPEPGAPLPPVDVLFPDGSTLRTDDDRLHVALSGVLRREVRVEARHPGRELRLMTPAARDRRAAADDPRRARPHVVVAPAGDDPGGAAVGAAGSVLRLGAQVRVEVEATGDDVAGVVVAPGEVRVGDGVSG